MYRLLNVGFDSASRLIESAEVALRDGIAGLRSALEPTRRFSVIRGNAVAFQVFQPDHKLRAGVAFGRHRTQPV